MSPKSSPLRIETGTQGKFLPNLDYRHDSDHSQTARKEIAGLGLSGQHAKEVKNWHENHVIHEIRTSVEIFEKPRSVRRDLVRFYFKLSLDKSLIYFSHTAHEGGSDPNEKNHITASFYRVVHSSHSWAIFRSFLNSFLGHF